MNLLIFAGAGSSVELGVPGMQGMATEFLAHTKQWGVEPDITERLMESSPDIEVLVEHLDHLSAATPAARILKQDLDLARIATLRAEVEWFLQHAAERVVASSAHILWGPVLRFAVAHRIAVVTTNYDRAIELAGNAQGVSLADGFERFGDREVASWVGLDRPYADATPMLVKLHGSTDWYSEVDSGRPVKLRHPMPLFGGGSLQLPSRTLGSALILPSREKLMTHAPYPRLLKAFLTAADDCDAAVFIGSSLRDIHVRDAAVEMAKDKPVFLISRRGDRLGLAGVYTIAESASTFLMSTLPKALTSDAPVEGLKQRSGDGQTASEGILATYRLAIDQREDVERRCRAVEHLDELGTVLEGTLVRQLLLDSDSTVARHALGLVAALPQSGELLDFARNSVHAQDAAFADELRLLEHLVQLP